MIQDARIGAFVKSLPIPHEPADTMLFPAGPVTIGLEYRVFDPVAEAAKLTQVGAGALAASIDEALVMRAG